MAQAMKCPDLSETAYSRDSWFALRRPAAPIAFLVSAALGLSYVPATSAHSGRDIYRAAETAQKRETVAQHVTSLVHPFADKVLVFAKNHKEETNLYYGHGKLGVGLSETVSSSALLTGNKTVDYTTNVTFGYSHGHVNRKNIISASAAEVIVEPHQPGTDIELLKDPGTGAWLADGFYTRPAGKPYNLMASTNAQHGKHLAAAPAEALEHQMEAILKQQICHLQANCQSTPQFMKPPTPLR